MEDINLINDHRYASAVILRDRTELNNLRYDLEVGFASLEPFINVVWFDDTLLLAAVRPVGMTEWSYQWSLSLVRSRGTTALVVPIVVGAVDFFHSILGAFSSYKLGMRCSLARWIRMDEGYNTMALDLDYIDFEN